MASGMDRLACILQCISHRASPLCQPSLIQSYGAVLAFVRVSPSVSLCLLHCQPWSQRARSSVALTSLLVKSRAAPCAFTLASPVQTACTRASRAADLGMEQKSAASQRRSRRWCRQTSLYHLKQKRPRAPLTPGRSSSQWRSLLRLCLCLALVPRVKESRQIMVSSLPRQVCFLQLRCRLLFSRPAVLQGCTGPRPLLPIH